MRKTWLIIKREYLTRVRKRTFIISTLLFPLFYVGLIFGTSYVAEKSRQSLKVAIIDSSGYFTDSLLTKYNKDDKSSTLVLANGQAAKVIADHKEAGYDAYIVIPKFDWKSGINSLQMKAAKSYGSGQEMVVRMKLNRIWDEIKNDSLRIDTTTQNTLLRSHLDVAAKNIKDEKANAKAAERIGFISGILIYIILLIYGSQVMMGVLEEKTNRIAEVIVSSVKPFQMMMGKILGIAMVALTQFLLWFLFIVVIYNVTKMTDAGGGIANQMTGQMMDTFSGVNLPLVLTCFIFYFLGGFFFYSSLYGAIGSAVNEDMREAQSLAFPVTMLVIFSIIIAMNSVSNPESPIAVWASIIPFSSPIVMMARIPFGVPNTVPWWQLGLSMSLLVLSFLFTTWFAGKIYRTGILMYGKKASWKEMIRWAFRK